MVNWMQLICGGGQLKIVADGNSIHCIDSSERLGSEFFGSGRLRR